MSCFLLSLFFLGIVALSGIHADVQEQGPEDHEHLVVQVKELERNLTELWTRVHDLEKATLQHLTHLRQHQVEIESTLNHIGPHDGHHDDHHSSGHGDDHHGDHVGHGDDHHNNHSGHGDEHHGDHHDTSHSSDHHDSSHSSDHHDDHHSSHSDEHHTDDHHSSQSEHHDNDHHDDHHSSSTDDHHHDHQHTEQKPDSGDGHDHHSSSTDDHHHDHHHTEQKSGSGDDHDHHDDHHGDHSKEKDDHSKEHDNHSKEHSDQQQTKDVTEPLIVPMKHKSHSYHDNRQMQHNGKTEDVLSQFSKHESTHKRQNQTLIPTFQDRNYLNFAECGFFTSLASDLKPKQDVIGKVSFWQKKDGGPLGIYLHMQIQELKVDGHQDHQQHDDSDHNEMPIGQHGHKYGFHVHEFGDISDGCQHVGPHFNPEHVNHEGPHSNIRHVGDFGNIECNEHGFADMLFYDDLAALSGSHSILNRSLVIHENEDDLETHPQSLTTENTGAPIACCIIHSVKGFSLRTFKNIKHAASRHHR